MSGYPDDVTFNPERMLHPLRRVGAKGEGRFERVSWDEALDEVAARLKKIVAEHGADRRSCPTATPGPRASSRGTSLDRRFFARLGRHAARAGRLRQRRLRGAARRHSAPARGSCPQDVVAQPASSWSGARTPRSRTPTGGRFVLEARRRGARLVVIDPLRSRTAEQADWHLRPRPGTDAALALGMMHVIVRDGLHDADYVERHTLGFDRLRAAPRGVPARAGGGDHRARRRGRRGARPAPTRRRGRPRSGRSSAWSTTRTAR